MSRNPKDAELNELANRLSQIPFHGDGTGAPIRTKWCHRVGGRYRVTRAVRGELLTLGWTDSEAAASFFSDCLTECLWLYSGDGDAPDSVFNESDPHTRNALKLSNIQMVGLAERVTEYVIDRFHLPDYTSLMNSRRIGKAIVDDLFLKSEAARAESQKAERAFSKLYQL